MKAASLLFLRTTTGIFLIIWGYVRLTTPEVSINVAKKFYGDILSAETLQLPLGLLQILLGLMVILGLFRKFTYPLQALVITASAVGIWQYLADPLGLYFFTEETRRPVFFPSATLMAASLVLLVFVREDKFILERYLKSTG